MMLQQRAVEVIEKLPEEKMKLIMHDLKMQQYDIELLW